MAFEELRHYVAASAFRFTDEGTDLRALYDQVMAGDGAVIERRQSSLLA
jgi:hypothetical protein